MYSIKFAAKLVKIKRLCKNLVDKLSIFSVLSTYYLTFRLVYATLTLAIILFLLLFTECTQGQ